MSILSDREIKCLALEEGMIQPFQDRLINEENGRRLLSYGLSSYGYDIRLSAKQCLVFGRVQQGDCDPKSFDTSILKPSELLEDEKGKYFLIPPYGYCLGVAQEYINLPEDVTVVAVGKSTYARSGIMANITPAEACMAEDTDILAKTGWKKLKDVIIGEEVLTFNPITCQSEYKPVLKKQTHYYNGKLLHFHGKYVDQLVTPDHKMWAAKRAVRVEANGRGWDTMTKGTRRERKDCWNFEFMQADKVHGQWNHYLSRDLRWVGKKPEATTQIGKHIFPTEFWLRFLGAWMGDGSAYKAKHGNYVVKLAVVSKVQKRIYYRWVLENIGVKFQESKWGFSFNSKDLVTYLLPYKGAHNKHIPNEIKQLDSTSLSYVIEGMMNSDGNKETSTYVSVSERLIDDFQEICLKSGYNCTKWLQNKPVFASTECTVYKARYSTANVTPSKLTPGKNYSQVDYSGMVYDITVDNHVFYSRRNGRASWTGNCWSGHLTLEISNCTGLFNRIYANEGICQLLFFRGNPCDVTYSDRKGKYQNQPHEIVFSQV
jgi:deoxycytidine triphosphate deaminase